jgi:hypothetical protein
MPGRLSTAGDEQADGSELAFPGAVRRGLEVEQARQRPAVEVQGHQQLDVWVLDTAQVDTVNPSALDRLLGTLWTSWPV